MPPPIRTRLVGQLIAGGMPAPKANAVATKKLQAAGDLKPGSTSMTAKGEARTKLGAAGRAKDRAATASGHQAGDYKYDAQTNRARLK